MAFTLYAISHPSHFFSINLLSFQDNYPEPGKRPLSSMSPTIIENADGSFYVAIGGAGGSRIAPSIVQVLLNLERGLDISAAVEHSRLHDQLYPLRLEIEDTYPAAIIESLRERGHNVTGKFMCPRCPRCY
jgi:gamma-glutamyltranspeptidase/glutathione hydrolase/leukotriene-C4 hydrolase